MSFKALSPSDFLVSADSVTQACWSNDVNTLTSFFTSSTQESSTTGKFYLDVYQTSSTTSNASVQFSIAWGDINGSGSSYFNSAVPNITPSKDIYGQYRALILGDENSKFMFNTVSGSNQIAVISVAREKYKQAAALKQTEFDEFSDKADLMISTRMLSFWKQPSFEAFKK
jgi:hypothetical protein